MKKAILLFVSIIVFNLNIYSQVAIAKLKFEDAETAYNNGDFSKTITRLAEAEKLFGKINSPILHLRILAQNKLFLQTRENELGFELKKNCATFLKDYADVEALEDKYKEVYRINENLSDVPANQEELKLFKEKKDKEYQDGKNKYRETIERYVEAFGGKDKLENVKSIEIIIQVDPIGYLDVNGQKVALAKTKHTFRVKDKERAYYEIKGPGIATTTYITTPGKVIYELGRSRMPTDEVLVKKWNEKLIIYQELTPISENDSVYFEQQIDQGKKMYLLTKKNENAITKMVFDANTGLKVSETRKSAFSQKIFEESEIQIKSYAEFEGIKFPDDVLQKFIHTSVMNQSDIQIFEALNKSKLTTSHGRGVQSFSELITNSNKTAESKTSEISKLKKETHSYNTKIISVKINPEFRDKDLE